mmetsp:Transcript_25585/g.60300  ORF Transcript_25585/g.60300 Transcript_25585/m.60300 type:complete len:91 (-) Transcript_25585:231-503(-)
MPKQRNLFPACQPRLKVKKKLSNIVHACSTLCSSPREDFSNNDSQRSHPRLLLRDRIDLSYKAQGKRSNKTFTGYSDSFSSKISNDFIIL